MPADTPKPYSPETEIAKFTTIVAGEDFPDPRAPTPKTEKPGKPAKEAPFKAAKPAPEPDDDEPDDAADAGDKPAKNAVQTRIDKAVGRQRAAERASEVAEARATALEARLAALEKGLTPQTTARNPANESPNPATFTYGELDPKYIAALARHETKLAIAESNAAQIEAQQTSKQTAAQAQAQKHYSERLADISAKGAAKYGDDFEDVVMQGIQRNEWPLSQTLAELLLESDFAPDIAFELASDVELAKKVFLMTPSKQAAWFGRKEAKFEDEAPEPEGEAPEKPARAAPARTLSKAPAPLAYKGKGAAPQSAGAPSSFSDFEAKYGAGSAKR